jgi:pimeloyl-ACP methyl ester carboxylesterase
MKISFQRIITGDGLELHGLLFEPDRKTTNVLVHLHGWMGNFYENKFIDYIAKEAISKGFAFLAFNNRGTGIITDLIKRGKSKVEYIRIGGSLEKFEDCILDIKAAIDFISEKGYKKIVLQGHSLGCQKATFYKYNTRDKRIKGLILLAPVDDPGFTKKELKNKYEKSLRIARGMVKKGKGDKLVPKWMAFYPLLNVSMFLSVTDPKSSSGRLFDYSGKLKEIKNVNCPILAVFGTKDEYQSNPGEKLKILKENVRDCDMKLVNNAGHGFVGFEEILSKLIGNWLKTL